MDVELIISVILDSKLENRTVNRCPIVAQLRDGNLFIDSAYRE